MEFEIGKYYVVRKSNKVVKLIGKTKPKPFFVDENGLIYNMFGWCFGHIELKVRGRIADFDLQREAIFLERLINRKILK